MIAVKDGKEYRAYVLKQDVQVPVTGFSKCFKKYKAGTVLVFDGPWMANISLSTFRKEYECEEYLSAPQ